MVGNPVCQCRGHRCEPWSGKIPHAMEQLSPCATTTEPVLLSPCTTTTEPMHPRAHVPQILSPRAATTEACMPRACAPQQREATAMRSMHTAMRSSPRLPQLEKARTQQQRPNAAKNKNINKKQKQTSKKATYGMQ